MTTTRKSKRPVRKPAKRRKTARRAAKKTSARRKAARKTSSKTSRKVAKRSARKRVGVQPKSQAGLSAPPAMPFKFIDLDAAPRCRSRIPVEIEIAGRRETGAIADMSASGARIVGVKVDLPSGTPLQIRYASGTSPVLLSAELVRVTEDGFAVKILPR